MGQDKSIQKQTVIKKKMLFGGLLVLIVIFGSFYFLSNQDGHDLSMTEEEFIYIVETHYVNEDDRIRSYGTLENEEYLLESMGLYMQWLKKHGYEDKLSHLMKVLQRDYLVSERGNHFLSWVIQNDEQASINAWIDDARILELLDTDHPLYQKVAKSILKYQVNEGLIVDFYDWDQDAASQRVVLSYGFLDDPAFSTDKMRQLYEDASNGKQVFYPEFYNTEKKEFAKFDEVHMIDQLLIAIQMEKLSLNTDIFWDWLVAEWGRENKIQGRYERESKVGNQMESSSVYGFAADLAKLKGETSLSEVWSKRGMELIKVGHSDYSNIHFFDLMAIAP